MQLVTGAAVKLNCLGFGVAFETLPLPGFPVEPCVVPLVLTLPSLVRCWKSR